jgi:general secretion pathway protein A
MYLDYFGFDEPPFSITPDPKFVFLSKKHEESLAHLVYGITRGGGAGFVQLTGEVGTGKTTISRLLLDKIPKKTNIALILNPNITPLELLENICKELKIPMQRITGKLNRMVDKLNAYLLKTWSVGENTVVILDEAQNLPRDTLEQLRLLTNLETDKQKLLQIVLIGQPELRSTMRRSDLRQLAQRVTARYHLMPLSETETHEYLNHRIKVAGGHNDIINKSVAKKIHKLTDGVPRLINILTDRALLAAYSCDDKQLNKKHIETAKIEVLPETHNKPSNNRPYLMYLILSMALIVLSIYATYSYMGRQASVLPVNQNNNEEIKQDDIENNKPFVPANAEKSWKAFFTLWESLNDKNWHKTSCPDSKDTGMACLRRQGNLKQIENINHPVLLQLEDGRLVLLSAINNGMIRLLGQEDQFTLLDKNWLQHQWLGVYYILWPMPAELLLKPDLEKMQKWSLEMANTIDENTIDSQNLERWIIDFQKAHGLLADGIIGSETQMALSLMAYSGPTLTEL